MRVNHNPIKNAVILNREYFGTRWDYNDRLRIERAGYKPGFNVDGTGRIAYFKYVGCHGYEFFHLTVEELKAAKRLRVDPGPYFGEFFDYKPEDHDYIVDDDNGTCTRNERLHKEDPIKFFAILLRNDL